MQRSNEWKAKRLVTLTGTRCAALMGTPIARRTLMAEMAREALMASSKDFVKSKAMQKGVDDEPIAESVISIVLGYDLHSTDAYIEKPDDGFCAASPDGLVGDDGGVEIKNLDPENHIKVIIDGLPDKKYIWQMQWCMYVTGRQWWEYVGYCKELPQPADLFTYRVERCEKVMAEIDRAVEKFRAEFDSVMCKLGFNF